MKFSVRRRGIWDTLIKVAFLDGKLTRDEFDIIKNVLADLINYSSILEEALNDGIIDDLEKQKLQSQREKVIDKAKLIANKDYIITEEEKKLILTTKEILQNMQKL